MDLTYREVEVRDFDACGVLLQDREHYSGEALAALPEIWGQWLGSGALNAAVMELREGSAEPEIIQFGMSVFVTNQFLVEARTAGTPHLGVRLISRVLAGRSPVLDLAAIRAANSGDGLNLFVSHSGFLRRDWTPEQSLLIAGRAPESFFWLHQGYNFREMLLEYYDVMLVQLCLAAGFRLREGSGDSSPQIVGITREEAATNPGTYVSKLFHSPAPRFFFSYGEQKVLLQALLGRNDEEIAALLDVALSTVKKRWVAIYDCVNDQLPEMLPEMPPEAIPPSRLSLQKRGQEKRRHLLAYLRQHPEELRPSVPRNGLK
jgi:hypothetical protein